MLWSENTSNEKQGTRADPPVVMPTIIMSSGHNGEVCIRVNVR